MPSSIVYSAAGQNNDKNLLATNKRWRSGVVSSNNLMQLCFFWFGGALMTVLPILLILHVLYDRGSDRGAAYLLAIFPLVGSLLVLEAIRETIQYFKYGKSSLDLCGRVGRVGGKLEAIARCSKIVRPEGNFTVRLTCTETVHTGSGKNRHMQTKTLWKKEKEIDRASGNLRDGLRIEFDVPSTYPPSGNVGTSDSVNWKLYLKVQTSGIDYETEFDVPIFR